MDNDKGTENNDNASQVVDADKLKSDIMAMNKENNQQLTDTIMSSVNNLVTNIREGYENASSSKDKKEVVSDSLSEFTDEIQALDIGEGEARAVMSMVNKLINKNNRELEGKIEKKSDFKTKKEQFTMKAAEQYPDILNTNSKLWKQAKNEFNHMSKETRESPEGWYLAITTAAQFLGIRPVDINEYKAHQAHSETDSKRGGKKSNEITDSQLALAEQFGLDKGKFKEKLKQVFNKEM